MEGNIALSDHTHNTHTCTHTHIHVHTHTCTQTHTHTHTHSHTLTHTHMHTHIHTYTHHTIWERYTLETPLGQFLTVLCMRNRAMLCRASGRREVKGCSCLGVCAGGGCVCVGGGEEISINTWKMAAECRMHELTTKWWTLW